LSGIDPEERRLHGQHKTAAARLLAGDPQPQACEIAALLGYRIAILDMEHGVIGPEAADRLVAECRLVGLTVYVRVGKAERLTIQQGLDSGADGVLLPQIADPAHAAEASAYAKYPPLGNRGIGYSRTMRYGAVDDRFFADENKRTLCHPMIETPGALKEVEAILALDTVDGVFVGPSDLSMLRGRGNFAFREEDRADFRRIASAARKAGKAWGIPAPNAEGFAFAGEEGAAYVTVSDDLTALQVGLAAGLTVAG
jgi:2-dehydro-3-deoxyglucarate aldolase/4-hydroxy-2-oxoheptanedioate aldolase